MSILLPPCKTCRFWGIQFQAKNGERMARCHRFPPTPRQKSLNEMIWPITGEMDACGEHEERL